METSPKPIVINQDQAALEEKKEQKAAVKAIEIAFMKKKKAEEEARKIQFKLMKRFTLQWKLK